MGTGRASYERSTGSSPYETAWLLDPWWPQQLIGPCGHGGMQPAHRHHVSPPLFCWRHLWRLHRPRRRTTTRDDGPRTRPSCTGNPDHAEPLLGPLVPLAGDIAVRSSVASDSIANPAVLRPSPVRSPAGTDKVWARPHCLLPTPHNELATETSAAHACIPSASAAAAVRRCMDGCPVLTRYADAVADSWIEIESQPSSSSLSSAAPDDIVTTGLRVQHGSHPRPSRPAPHFHTGLAIRTGEGSSQDADGESESESDRVLTSSNEHLGPSPLRFELRRPSRNAHSGASSATTSEHEVDNRANDDENATAVNAPQTSGRVFIPQPNAFTHPPPYQDSRALPGRPRPGRRPAARHESSQHSPYSAVAPYHQADHDAALRASLSTLLSAAAAVRGLPKPSQSPPLPRDPPGRVDPSSLRLVPESVALGEGARTSLEISPPSASPRATSASSAAEKEKRRSGVSIGTRSRSKDRRIPKKARRNGLQANDISPTLLTWVVSAGVVALVSALSFSAGYVVGREAGHAEATGPLGSVAVDAGRCSQEAASGMARADVGLRRLRWSASPSVRA